MNHDPFYICLSVTNVMNVLKKEQTGLFQFFDIQNIYHIHTFWENYYINKISPNTIRRVQHAVRQSNSSEIASAWVSIFHSTCPRKLSCKRTEQQRTFILTRNFYRFFPFFVTNLYVLCHQTVKPKQKIHEN